MKVTILASLFEHHTVKDGKLVKAKRYRRGSSVDLPTDEAERLISSGAAEKAGRGSKSTSDPAKTGEDQGDGDPENQGDDGDQPQRPKNVAPVDDWRVYAVAVGAATPEDAAGMDRDALIAAVDG